MVVLALKYGNEWKWENGVWFIGNGLFITATVAKVIPPPVLSLLLVSTGLMSGSRKQERGREREGKSAKPMQTVSYTIVLLYVNYC